MNIILNMLIGAWNRLTEAERNRWMSIAHDIKTALDSGDPAALDQILTEHGWMQYKPIIVDAMRKYGPPDHQTK